MKEDLFKSVLSGEYQDTQADLHYLILNDILEASFCTDNCDTFYYAVLEPLTFNDRYYDEGETVVSNNDHL